jgi:hypothetical protein
MLVMEPPDRPAVVVARVVIAHLQQGLQALIDSDRVLPADASSLLATLDRAQERLSDEDAPAARAGIEAFSIQAQALIETGVLDAADGGPRIEAAAALVALLGSAAATNAEQ